MAFENLKSTGIKYVLTKMKDYFLQIKDAVKSVNGEEPDETGDITLNSVPYAQNLESESSHRSYDTFIERTAGGDSSVNSGEAWLMTLRGNSEHDGFTPESITMTVTAVSDPAITATLDRDTFVSEVTSSGTVTLAYSTSWNVDPATYGVTVTGTPAAGDTITIVYVKEIRGTITVANPQSFTATGWNLYDHSAGYAKVVKYDFGYRISGTYTAIKYSATPTGTQSDVVVNDGSFDIPADGYIHVTGGNSTDTAIFATWEDWSEGYTGDFETYTESEVDLSTVMASAFPYGLLKVDDVYDELDLNLGQAISRVERLLYTESNLATAKASGRAYEYDENYIYLVRASAATTAVSVDGDYTVNDHGIEFFTGSDIPVYAEILYGNNLKNKLERDVLTISSQTLNSTQKSQVRSNLGLGTASTKSVANDLTTESAGSAVLDAYQGKLLADQVDAFVKNKSYTIDGSSFEMNFANNDRHIIMISAANATLRSALLFVSCSGNGSMQIGEAYTGTSTTVTAVKNKITVTYDASTRTRIIDFMLFGDFITVNATPEPEPET